MCKEKHLKYNGTHTKELLVCLVLNSCLVPHSPIPAHDGVGDRVTGAHVLKDSCYEQVRTSDSELGLGGIPCREAAGWRVESPRRLPACLAPFNVVMG